LSEATTLVTQALNNGSAVNGLPVLGKHFFTLSTFSTSALPKFDMTSVLGSQDAFELSQKVGSVASPSGAANAVAWLQLNVLEGKLGSTVLRTDTQAGVLMGSCTAGQTSTAKYAALVRLCAIPLTLPKLTENVLFVSSPVLVLCLNCFCRSPSSPSHIAMASEEAA